MARATSIISTSGAGASLEARIAATYLSALIAQASGPGDDAAHVVEGIAFQRTHPAAGFDDLHLRHTSPTGDEAVTFLQIKRTLTGARSEEAFRRPVADAARLLSAGRHDDKRFRIVASESAISPRDVDRASDAARLSDDAIDFWARWNAPGNSSPSERYFTSAVQWVIEQDLGSADPELAWKVISRIGVAVVDADQGGSQAKARAVDQLQGALASGDRDEAVHLYEALCLFAENAAKVTGGVDRAKLLAELSPRFRLLAAPSARADVALILSDGDAALAGIRNDVGGVSLTRATLCERLEEVLTEAGGLRLGGDAGAGKSAVLRTLAERRRSDGAGSLVLKHDRLAGCTWAAHATNMGVATPLARLVTELAASGSAVLVIDGYDRIADAGFGELVREVCQAISDSRCRPLWSCILSSRDSAGPGPTLELPLVDDAVPYNVGAPDDEDLAFLAERFPHLDALMSRRGYADLNRNLFFIDQMARNPSVAGASSELDLMQAWARRGSSETPRHTTRDATLRTLGEQRLTRPYGPMQKPSDEDGLARLASERTVEVPPYRDVVSFGHDIYEDWAVARALDARRSDIPAILLRAGQPLAWMRAIRLVAETALESDGPAGWRALHDLLGGEALDPLWRRIALTAALHSRRAASLLDALEPTLLADGGQLLADLIETLLTLEVRPHPLVLTAPQFDGIEPARRRRLALGAAVPRVAPWHSFLMWSAGRWSAWPKQLVPSLTRATLTWLRLPGRGRALAGRLVVQCIAWLSEIDAINAMPFDQWEERSRLLREMGADRSGSADPVREHLRLAIASGAADAVAEVDAYLAGLLEGGGRGGVEFVDSPGVIPTVLPGRFVDLVASTMIMRHDPDEPLDYAVEQSDGIRDQGRFFPASPVRAGFNLLFASDEDQALRLLELLGAAVASVWRRREAGRGRAARPLVIEHAEGVAELWGDQYVYKWVRGLLGPRLLGSLLLAADDWFDAQVAAGRPLDELCAKLLRHSHLVASASICVAGAMRKGPTLERLRQALPLVTVPRLWAYDLRLSLEDTAGTAFRMGWSQGDEHAFRAAAATRDRRKALLPLVEGLVMPLHLAADASLKADFATAVARWRVEDLADFDEQLDDEDALAELGEELENWRAKADPANWDVERTEEQGAFSVAYTPPAALSERAAEALERKEELEEGAGLLDWAFGHARGGVTRKGQTYLDALPIAKGMDEPDLFLHALDLHPGYAFRAQGVAAVAAAIATHADEALLHGEMDWVISVLGRAAAVDHASSALHDETSLLDDDAAASAARGLGALTMRGLADEDHIRIWLGLVASPFRSIAKAALEPAAAFVEIAPSAAAAALSVSAASMLYAWEAWGMDLRERMRGTREARCLDAIDAAVAAHSEGRLDGPSFPRPVTEHFVGGDAFNPCAGEPENQFDHYRAGAVWGNLDVRSLAAVTPIRDLLLPYLSDALAWYASYIEFQDARGWSSPSRLMEWESVLGRLCGQLASPLPAATVVERLIQPAAAMGDAKARNDLLAAFLDGFAHEMVDQDLPIDVKFATVWRSASAVLFETARREGSRRYDPDETPLAAAAFAHYRYPVFEPDWPRAGELAPLLAEWVDACKGYRFSACLVARLVAQAGTSFVADPGLRWLEAIVEAHRSTVTEDWRGEIGGAAGELLTTLWARTDAFGRRDSIVRFRSVAAILADRGVVSAAELLPEIAVVQSGG